MKRILLSTALLVGMVSDAIADAYKSTDGSAPTLPFVLQEGDRVYAATIGLDWASLPTPKHIYWGSSASWLNFTGEIYLTGVTEVPGSNFIPFATPRLLSGEDWFAVPFSYTLVESRGTECCFYHPCPNNSEGYPQIYNSSTHGCEGHYCTQDIVHNFEGRLIYYPTLGFDGNITIEDKHGGSSGDALFWLQAAGPTGTYYIVFRWAKPGVWRNAVTGVLEDKFPGNVFDTVVYDIGPPPTAWQVKLRTKAVHHTSSDISATSPGYIDSSDLASLAYNINHSSCVGYGTATGCQDFVWFADLNVDEVDVDSSDLSVLASEIDGYECNTSPSKTQESDKEAMFAWFGIEATGRTITFEGTSIPEYDVVDWVKCQRAIGDPYGWQRQLTGNPLARKVPWSIVKRIYR